MKLSIKFFLISGLFFIITEIGHCQLDSLFNMRKLNWKKDSPLFINTQKSFFNKNNANDFFIFKTNFKTDGSTLTFDCDFNFVEILKKGKLKYKIRKFKFPNYYHDATIIELLDTLPSFIICGNMAYNSKLTGWILDDDRNFECPGNINFPYFGLSKTQHGNNSITTQSVIFGISILGDKNYNIHKFNWKINKAQFEAINHAKIEVEYFDINSDGIPDLFWYTEILSKSKRYFRLYMNIDGVWTIKWIFLDEECL